MKLYKIISLHILCISTNYGIELKNESILPVLIDKIVLHEYNGIEHVPSIKQKSILLAPHQTMNHTKLTGQAEHIITQIMLIFNNMLYTVSIPIYKQDGEIVIDNDHITASDSVITEYPLSPQKELHHVGPYML